MGKFTQKTNMAKMRAVLLDRALGFTIGGPPLQPLSDAPKAGGKGDEGTSEPDSIDAGVSKSTPLASDGNVICSGEFFFPWRVLFIDFFKMLVRQPPTYGRRLYRRSFVFAISSTTCSSADGAIT
jgi:hypothetical protein